MPSIDRRDFLNGIRLAIAAGLTPAAQMAAAASNYPPALTGLRGQGSGSLDVAHALALQGKKYSIAGLPVEAHYDLVVIGAGISGLAAAWFYLRQSKGARVLILDNLEDFGGHANRNEFQAGGRLIVGYGGAESLEAPGSYSSVAKGLLQDLHVDVARLGKAFNRKLYTSLGLSRATFFDRAAFGRDALVTGDPTAWASDGSGADRSNTRPVRQFIADFPVSAKTKDILVKLYEQTADPLPGRTNKQKVDILQSTSYRDYLMKYCGCNDEAANTLQGRTLDYFGLGCDAVAADAVLPLGYPGFSGLHLPSGSGAAEPYIYHFPDGNASIARLLVRALIPGVAPGNTMDDIVVATFDYDKLDGPAQPVCIRLNSTCVSVSNQNNKVSVGYVRNGSLNSITADHVVLACFNMMIPYIMPELPEAQRQALAQNVKTPLISSNVVVNDWNAWVKLGVHQISAPMSFHSRVKLDYPVSLGGYSHPGVPSQPICVHMSHVSVVSNQGFDAREQDRRGRKLLLDMSFEEIEGRIRDDLDRMLGPGGFSSERDIAAITVNRWSHGYSYWPNALFDGADYKAIIARARQPAGRVSIANSDSNWRGFTDSAIDAAYRAVHEQIG